MLTAILTSAVAALSGMFFFMPRERTYCEPTQVEYIMPDMTQPQPDSRTGLPVGPVQRVEMRVCVPKSCKPDRFSCIEAEASRIGAEMTAKFAKSIPLVQGR